MFVDIDISYNIIKKSINMKWNDRKYSCYS